MAKSTETASPQGGRCVPINHKRLISWFVLSPPIVSGSAAPFLSCGTFGGLVPCYTCTVIVRATAPLTVLTSNRSSGSTPDWGGPFSFRNLAADNSRFSVKREGFSPASRIPLSLLTTTIAETGCRAGLPKPRQKKQAQRSLLECRSNERVHQPPNFPKSGRCDGGSSIFPLTASGLYRDIRPA